MFGLTKNLDLDLGAFFPSPVLGDELVVSRIVHRNGRDGNLGKSAAISGKFPPALSILCPLALALGPSGDFDARVEGGSARHLELGVFALQSRLHVGSWQKLGLRIRQGLENKK